MQPVITVTVDTPSRWPTVDGLSLADWLRRWRDLHPDASGAAMLDDVPIGLLPSLDRLWRDWFRAVARDVLGDACPTDDDS